MSWSDSQEMIDYKMICYTIQPMCENHDQNGPQIIILNS